MQNNRPTLEIRGQNAAQAEQELQALFEAELGERAARLEAPAAAERGATRSDPVAVAALILAIPSAILATMDLAQRLKLKQRVDRLLDWARSKRAADPGIELTLVTSDGRALPLDRAEAGEVLDALAKGGEDTPDPAG